MPESDGISGSITERTVITGVRDMSTRDCVVIEGNTVDSGLVGGVR